MSKIELTDSTFDVLAKMSEGNPGGLVAVMKLMKDAEEIDPQSILKELGPILLLDTYEIYGSSIHILYKDKCNSDTRKVILLLRATQLGLFPEGKLKEMATDQTYKINLTDLEWIDIDEAVCGRLIDFQR